MDATSTAENLREEVTCPICLDYFTDPVSTECGHNFCRSCITQSWERIETNFPCPQCRETSQQKILRPNRQLANVTEMVRKLSACSVKPKGENLCEEHEEKLKLFCEEDLKVICVICRESRNHRSHTTLPIEEAVPEYKEKIKLHLEPLRKELAALLVFKSNEEKKTEKMRSDTEIKKKKIESEFEELHQVLNKEKQIILFKLEEEEKRILQRIRENVTQLEEQSSFIMQLISEIEEKSQQPAAELLKDVKDIFIRCQKAKFPKPETVSTDLKMSFLLCSPQQLKRVITESGDNWRTRTRPVSTSYIESRVTTEGFRMRSSNAALASSCCNPVDSIRCQTPSPSSGSSMASTQPVTSYSPSASGDRTRDSEWWMKFGRYAANVTLDPETAHASIILSEDRKSVRDGFTRQKLPQNPQRFDHCVSVLGCESFNWGRHYWEVEVGDETEWDLGVCKDSVRRKGAITVSPEDGYWAMTLRNGNKYFACTSHWSRLNLKVRPRVVGIFLDYEAGKVSFYNADNKFHLFTFTDTFTEELRPYFSPSINRRGKNAGALRIRPMADWE